MKSYNILLILMFTILFSSLASASLLDSKKEIEVLQGQAITIGEKDVGYNALWSQYKPLRIEKWLGLGDIVFEGALDHHTDSCGIDCISGGELYLDGETAIEDIRFYLIHEDGSKELVNIRSYQIEIQDSINYETIKDYENVCSMKTESNGTIWESCEDIEVGSHQKEIVTYKEYNLGDVPQRGNYKFQVKGNKAPTQIIDWQIKVKGKWLEEWSTWGTIIGTPLIEPASIGSNGVSNGQTQKLGVNITALQNIILLNATLGANGDCAFGAAVNITFVYLQDKAGNTMDSAPVIYTATQRYANFTGTNRTLTSGQAYYIVADASGAAYSSCKSDPDGGLPYINTNTRTHGDNLGDAMVRRMVFNYTTQAITIGSNVTILSPVAGFNTTSRTVNFSAGATVIGGSTLVNMSLWENSTGTFKINQTRTVTGTTDQDSFLLTFPADGNFLWNIQACDSDGVCGITNANRTLNIDSLSPNVSIIYPRGIIEVGKLSQNTSLNYSLTDASGVSSAWFIYDGASYNVVPTLNATFVLTQAKNLTLYANDSSGNTNSNQTFWDYEVFENSRTYNPTALETSTETYILNITFNTTRWLSAASNLDYNGTLHSSTKTTDGLNTIFTSQVNLPAVSSNQVKNLFWNVLLTNSTSTYYFNTSSSQQNITKIVFIKCNSTITSTYINFTVYSATSPYGGVNATFLSTFYYWAGGDGSIRSNYTFMENAATPTNNSFKFCASPNTSTIYVDADIQYGAPLYANNYFYFKNQSLNSTTKEQSLFLLNSSISTITTFIVKDSYQNGLPNYITYIYQKDLGTDTNRMVGMLRSNYQGQDIAYLNWFDTLYKFDTYDPLIVSKVYSTEPFKISSTPQTFRIVTVDSNLTQDKFENVIYNLTVNNNTGTFLLTFSDPDLKITGGCLRIVYANGANVTIISDNCVSSTSGTLTYTAPSGINGTYYGIFYAKGSNRYIDVVIFSAIDYLNDIYTQIGNLDGTVLALLIIGLSAFVGIFSPVAFIVMSMVGYIFAIFLGFQTTNSGSFQVAFFTFLCIGGYLVWKLRT